MIEQIGEWMATAGLFLMLNGILLIIVGGCL
jgi:hypothetical protein